MQSGNYPNCNEETLDDLLELVELALQCFSLLNGKKNNVLCSIGPMRMMNNRRKQKGRPISEEVK